MNFKSVIIFFNALMVFFLGIIFVMPIIVLGKEMAFAFWQSGWFLAPLILAILVFMDLFFALNYRIYSLLEKEDWPALIQELEFRILERGLYRPRMVTLLINTYLVLSDTRSVTDLEKRLSTARKNLVSKNALSFGTARILNRDYEGAADFFTARLSERAGVKKNNAEWLHWYYGFSLLLSRRFEESAEAFTVLAFNAREAIPAALSSYFLGENLAAFLFRRSEELRKEAEAGKERVKKALPTRNAWNKECKRVETEIYAAILQPYMEKTANYLYGKINDENNT